MNIQRSTTNRVVAGICGGLAEHLGWSPFRVRLVWIIATFLTAFSGVLLYLALWFLMPRPPLNHEPAVLQPWRKTP